MSEAANDSINPTSELTLEEKASLCLGSDFWHTAPVEHLGIPDHGLRMVPTVCAQLEEADHVESGQRTCDMLPTAPPIGLLLESGALRTVGEALWAERRRGWAYLSPGRGST